MERADHETEADARERDEADPLHSFRERFAFPGTPAGEETIYLCGNSLGLCPEGAGRMLQEEIADWKDLGVEGHFEGRRPWYRYHEWFREPLARLVGAEPTEVVAMNSLTVNLHLLMVSFYRPTAQRTRILIEAPAFPSDRYVVETQIRHHGLEVADALEIIEPEPGEDCLRTDAIEERIAALGDELALVFMSGVNFLTGQLLDLKRITAAAHRVGAFAGFDLAHAAGNVPLRLHDDGVDFAAWCSYKYLNGGPGAIGGAFVHERHAKETSLPRFGGWWGNDPDTRFRMQLEETFRPVPSADGWQLSNPPIFSLTPLRASLELFDEAGGISALRRRARRLTAYLESLLLARLSDRVAIVTPSDPDARGCQLSVRLVDGNARRVQEALKKAGVICDFREPDILRLAPVPLYNSHHDVWRFVDVLADRI